MKALVFFLATLAAAAAQDAPVVRAATRIFADGSRALTVTDLDKHTTTETVTDAGGRMMRKTLFTLDDAGQSTGAIHYDAKNNVRYKEAYKRNSAGQVTASYLYSKEDRLLGRREFIYDGNGKVAQIDDYDSSGKLMPKAATPAPGKKRR